MDKHTLFTLQFAGLEDVRPHGEKVFRNGRRFRVTQVFQRQRNTVMNQAIFRISPPATSAHTLSPTWRRLQSSRQPQRHPRFPAPNRGSIRRRRVTALTLEDVRPVDTGCGDFNQQVFSCTFGNGISIACNTSGPPCG